MCWHVKMAAEKLDNCSVYFKGFTALFRDLKGYGWEIDISHNYYTNMTTVKMRDHESRLYCKFSLTEQDLLKLSTHEIIELDVFNIERNHFTKAPKDYMLGNLEIGDLDWIYEEIIRLQKENYDMSKPLKIKPETKENIVFIQEYLRGSSWREENARKIS